MRTASLCRLTLILIFGLLLVTEARGADPPSPVMSELCSRGWREHTYESRAPYLGR